MGEGVGNIWAELYLKFIDHFPLAIAETLYMCVVSVGLAFVVGLALAVALVRSAAGGLSPNPRLYWVLSTTTNVLRSFPFIVLIVAIDPLTHLIAGSSIGTNAVIIPMTVGTAPFMARLLENSLNEVDKSVVEAAKSLGASHAQILFRVMFVEALPSIIQNITLVFIVVLGFSAMASVVGGGGVGALAISRGYNGFDNQILYMSVIVLLVIVQFFQFIGHFFYKLAKR